MALRLPSILSRRPRVFVDAKIVGMDGKHRRVYVGYKMEESPSWQNATQVVEPESEVFETDDAEARAIQFAIEDLQKKEVRRFIVVCDHQSVVSEILRKDGKPKNSFLANLQDVIGDGSVIGLEPLESNLAHKIVTDFVNSRKEILGG